MVEDVQLTSGTVGGHPIGMFYHLLLLFLSPLYALLGRLLLDDRDREIVTLRQQLGIMQRQLGRRPSLVPAERLALVLSSLRLSRRRLLGGVMIVTPATVVGWHRAIVRRHWRLLSRRKPGRPPEITPQMERLVLRIARENRWMGYTKIAGEMRRLGFSRSGRSSVARILHQHGLTPEIRRVGGLGWLQFFAHYGRFIWASDYLTVTTATLRTYYVIFFLDIATRRIVFWNVSTSPDEAWVAQQFRNLSVVNDELPRYLIHDRDSKYTRRADSLLEDVGTKVIRLPVRSPDLNAYAERWIRSLREECLDGIIVLNEAHLRWPLREYTSYYNSRRPHRSLRLLPPEAPDHYPCDGPIIRRAVLGGLINDYCRRAA
jgi:transposase InsO family protein